MRGFSRTAGAREVKIRTWSFKQGGTGGGGRRGGQAMHRSTSDPQDLSRREENG